jgi:hypothetical protein
MHIALPIARNNFLDIKGRCDQAKIKYQEVGGAIHVKDLNGLAIELMPFD